MKTHGTSEGDFFDMTFLCPHFLTDLLRSKGPLRRRPKSRVRDFLDQLTPSIQNACQTRAGLHTSASLCGLSSLLICRLHQESAPDIGDSQPRYTATAMPSEEGRDRLSPYRWASMRSYVKYVARCPNFSESLSLSLIGL